MIAYTCSKNNLYSKNPLVAI